MVEMPDAKDVVRAKKNAAERCVVLILKPQS
jgi:hypothetical protein